MIQRNSSLLVAALDELSDLTRALGKDVELQITRNNSNLLSLLVTHMEHPHAGVRQSVYALAGNMAGNCFSLLKPHVPKIIKQTLLQLGPEMQVEFVSACHNAVWSIGEIVLRYARGKFKHLQQNRD